MKQLAYKYTIDVFEKPRRGRPARPDAKSNAQRQREFRQRRKFDFLDNAADDDRVKNA